MRRFVQLATEPLVGEAEVVIEVPHAIVPTLALEMALLLNGRAESLRLRAGRGPAVVLALGAAKGGGTAEIRPDGVRFQLDTVAAEYLHDFLLRAYRDDVAEIDHLHFAGAPLELTVWFERSRDNLSIEEARELRTERED